MPCYIKQQLGSQRDSESVRSSVSAWHGVHSLTCGLGFHLSGRLLDWNWRRRQARLRTLCWKLRREPQCHIYCTRYTYKHLTHLAKKKKKENPLFHFSNRNKCLLISYIKILLHVFFWLYGNMHLPIFYEHILFHALIHLATSSNSHYQCFFLLRLPTHSFRWQIQPLPVSSWAEKVGKTSRFLLMAGSTWTSLWTGPRKNITYSW